MPAYSVFIKGPGMCSISFEEVAADLPKSKRH